VTRTVTLTIRLPDHLSVSRRRIVVGSETRSRLTARRRTSSPSGR
jgi:hypothetical protein